MDKIVYRTRTKVEQSRHLSDEQRLTLQRTRNSLLWELREKVEGLTPSQARRFRERFIQSESEALRSDGMTAFWQDGVLQVRFL